MKNRWNLFWSDYAKLFVDSTRFCKKHWFGLLVYMVLFALYIMVICSEWFEELICRIAGAFESLKTRLTSVFKKGKHEKE